MFAFSFSNPSSSSSRFFSGAIHLLALVVRRTTGRKFFKSVQQGKKKELTRGAHIVKLFRR